MSVIYMSYLFVINYFLHYFFNEQPYIRERTINTFLKKQNKKPKKTNKLKTIYPSCQCVEVFFLKLSKKKSLIAKKEILKKRKTSFVILFFFKDNKSLCKI